MTVALHKPLDRQRILKRRKLIIRVSLLYLITIIIIVAVFLLYDKTSLVYYIAEENQHDHPLFMLNVQNSKNKKLAHELEFLMGEENAITYYRKKYSEKNYSGFVLVVKNKADETLLSFPLLKETPLSLQCEIDNPSRKIYWIATEFISGRAVVIHIDLKLYLLQEDQEKIIHLVEKIAK